MEKKLDILILEDVQSDADLVLYEIKKSGIQFNYKLVDTEKEFTEAIHLFKPDLILSDYNLPQFTGMEALNIRNKSIPDIPFIIITGSMNETIAVECMKAGADDYILKDNLTRLGMAIQSVLKKKEIIDNKKKADIALWESEKNYRILNENIPNLIARFDRDYRHIFVNAAIERVTGLKREAFFGKTNEDLNMPEDQITIWNSKLKEVFETGNKVSFEFEFQSPEGVQYFFSQIVPEYDEDNDKVISALSVVTNITERKEYEIALVIAKEKAEEADKLKSAFLANMSHEVRTPMNAIIGFSELLSDPELSHGDRKRYIQIIVQRSYDLLGIINDILDISRMESGQLAVYEKEGDVSFVLNDLFNFFKSKNTSLDKKPIELRMNINLQKDQYNITTDFSRLKQILINLIGNSYKFTSKGFIEYGCNLINNDTELLFYVKDTGIGIPKEKQSIIFNRFRQVEDGYLKREYGGVGLGLSISKGLIELMNGTIWVESELDHGTTFYFTMPFKPTFKTDPVKLNLHKIDNWPDKVVLIVEDDHYNADYIMSVLKGTNVKLYLAESSCEALKLIESIENIDLIFMDIKLPDITGFELTSIIKQKKPCIPIIAQTAFASESDKQKCLDAGCDDYISKPIERTTLLKVLKKYFVETVM